MKAAQTAYEEVKIKVKEDLRRLEEERCGPVDAEYEKVPSTVE